MTLVVMEPVAPRKALYMAWTMEGLETGSHAEGAIDTAVIVSKRAVPTPFNRVMHMATVARLSSSAAAVFVTVAIVVDLAVRDGARGMLPHPAPRPSCVDLYTRGWRGACRSGRSQR